MTSKWEAGDSGIAHGFRRPRALSPVISCRGYDCRSSDRDRNRESRCPHVVWSTTGERIVPVVAMHFLTAEGRVLLRPIRDTACPSGAHAPSRTWAHDRISRCECGGCDLHRVQRGCNRSSCHRPLGNPAELMVVAPICGASLSTMDTASLKPDNSCAPDR
jgi:hypothetical protein